MTESESNKGGGGGERLRVHPTERFAPASQAFDLTTATAELAGEQGAAVASRGHRQKALYRHGGTSLGLFLFDAGGHLREHQVNGTVLIHVLEGQFDVQVGADRHRMTAGQVLAISPGVRHDVRAEQGGRMLLTVNLQPIS